MDSDFKKVIDSLEDKIYLQDESQRTEASPIDFKKVEKKSLHRTKLIIIFQASHYHLLRCDKFHIFTKSINMKAIKIYSIVATLVIVGLSVWVYSTKELKETEEVLDQCSDRYYQEINK
jgi:hypothetical protein